MGRHRPRTTISIPIDLNTIKRPRAQSIGYKYITPLASPNPTQVSGSGGSCSLGSISCPSLSSGQNVFLNRHVGSYFFLSATRRSQFSPKEAATRAGTSCLPRNCVASPHLRTLPFCTVKNCLTEGKAPPHATGLIVSRSHCVIDREGRKIVCHGQRGTRRGGEDLTSSALETQRGSSIPISHWCRAAMVNAAWRCTFGTHVPSLSTMAPPESSKSHAEIWALRYICMAFLKGKRGKER